MGSPCAGRLLDTQLLYLGSVLNRLHKCNDKVLDIRWAGSCPAEEAGARQSSIMVQVRPPKYVSLDKALLTWFNDIGARGAVVSDAMLTEKTKLD